MSKIQPNDPCPCGSGKKYKKCCGNRPALKYKDVEFSNLFLDDFVIENLDMDCVYLANALQIYIGPDGFKEFSDNADWYDKEMVEQ
jgi:hypothetical protein